MKIETKDPSLDNNNIYSTMQQPLQNSAPPNIVDASANDGTVVEKEEVKQAVDKMNKILQRDQRDVRYRIHEKTHRLMVQVIDRKTKEVLSAIPPEKILDIIAGFEEQNNIAIDKKA